MGLGVWGARVEAKGIMCIKLYSISELYLSSVVNSSVCLLSFSLFPPSLNWSPTGAQTTNTPFQGRGGHILTLPTYFSTLRTESCEVLDTFTGFASLLSHAALVALGHCQMLAGTLSYASWDT